ncbi:MAG: sigma-54-dependent Fis family transcriptional regulator [Spirochaetales bacterium]|nr:sigma-54-dependent Fis family transcriptional regulator [Spirochaetales bacterium]
MNDQYNSFRNLLLVDDEQDLLDSYKTFFRSKGINNVITCNDSRKALSIISEKDIHIVILDLMMPNMTGKELLETIKAKHPEIPIIINTGSSDVLTAVECMKMGAFDYVMKSEDENRLLTIVLRAHEILDLKSEVDTLSHSFLSDALENPGIFSPIITGNRKMLSLFKYIEAVSKSPKPILIAGETGSGKELIAQAVHESSGLTGQFVKLNVGGVDDNFFSDTLFGHKKGAFTGADEERRGLILEAKDGTLFLDEIGDLDPQSQVKLLRLLQDGEYYSLGSDVVRKSNAHIVAATNVNLKEKADKGLFRKDLYYRLIIHYIALPPLRERTDDIPLLLDHFTAKACEENKKACSVIDPEIYKVLYQYSFPGNVRELESIIYNAVSICNAEELTMECFVESLSDVNKDELLSSGGLKEELSITTSTGRLPYLKDVEEYLIEKAMDLSNGNQSMAAKMLGISQSTISKRLKKENE